MGRVRPGVCGATRKSERPWADMILGGAGENEETSHAMASAKGNPR